MCPEFGKDAGFVLWRRALGGMEIGRLCLGFCGWGLRGARRDGGGARSESGGGEGWGRGIFGMCGMCGRAKGMGMVCGEEGARRAGLGSGITLYALRN